MSCQTQYRSNRHINVTMTCVDVCFDRSRDMVVGMESLDRGYQPDLCLFVFIGTDWYGYKYFNFIFLIFMRVYHIIVVSN